MAALSRTLRRVIPDRRGVVSMEFALLLPLLVVAFLGMTEVGRYLLLELKVQTTAAKVADLMTRDRNPTQTSLEDAFNAVPTMLEPFPAGGKARTIVSSVVRANANDPPEVAWQLRGGGTLTASSNVGSPGSNADVPTDMVTAGGSAIIVAEMVYQYEPWLLGLVGARTLRDRAYFRPRLSGMRTLN
jgi:Flp pilus assembly protein TadG